MRGDAAQDAPGNKRLAAYCVPAADTEGNSFPRTSHPPAEEAPLFNTAGWNSSYSGDPLPREEMAEGMAARLRSFLAERLPDYMVPSTFVFLSELPLSPTGKIDRTALPAPGRLRMAGESGCVEPRDDLEKSLVEVWEEVLDRSPIGIRDNFFDLGGHSLLATRLLWKIEKAIGVNLPLKAIFRFATVEKMAASIRSECVPAAIAEAATTGCHETGLFAQEHKQMLAVAASGRVQPLRPGSLLTVLNSGGSRTPLFWCFNAPSAEHTALAEQLGGEQPLYGSFSGVGVLQWNKNIPAILAEMYIPEILAVQPHGPYRIGGNCGGAHVAVEIALHLQARAWMSNDCV